MATLKSIFGALAQRFIAWRERERAFAELTALDDHALADLGLLRSDIPMVVLGKRPEENWSETVQRKAAPANINGGLRAA